MVSKLFMSEFGFYVRLVNDADSQFAKARLGKDESHSSDLHVCARRLGKDETVLAIHQDEFEYIRSYDTVSWVRRAHARCAVLGH